MKKYINLNQEKMYKFESGKIITAKTYFETNIAVLKKRYDLTDFEVSACKKSRELPTKKIVETPKKNKVK